MRFLDDYRGIVSDEVLETICSKAATLSGIRMAHVNATAYGGGVAEILSNLILLMNDVGVRADWRVLHGTPEFFEVTKKFHNTLQGDNEISFSQEELDLYKYTNEKFAKFVDLGHDVVIIHDPQPAALVHYIEHSHPWIWRCHIDITKPNQKAWDFMAQYVVEYDKMIVSAEAYKRSDLQLEQQIMAPSIDPLSYKNMDLSQNTIDDYLKRENIPTDKPIITQVSRFDPWKDPEGVLRVWEEVRKEVDCRLVFCYNMAGDDPEGVRICEKMAAVVKQHMENGDVLFIRGDDPILVNVLQRYSSVVLQKSIREGFALVVTEALWKGAPVVASNVGGIPTQIKDGETGFLVDPHDISGCAAKVVQLLQDKDLAAEIGSNAREYVRENFLITRHLLDYLNLSIEFLERN